MMLINQSGLKEKAMEKLFAKKQKAGE